LLKFWLLLFDSFTIDTHERIYIILMTYVTEIMIISAILENRLE